MPLLYVFPSIVFNFGIEEDGMSAWSSWGFSYRTDTDGECYDLFLGNFKMFGKDVTDAKGSQNAEDVIISPDGKVVAPAISERNDYERAMQAYLMRFPERVFDTENNAVFFFPDAVNIIDAAAYEYEGKNYAFHFSLESGEAEDLESKNIGVCRIFSSGICVHQAPRGGRFVAIDSRLNELWSIERKAFGMDSCPINITDGPMADTVLLNLGYVEVKDQPDRDNVVVLMELSSGKCLWKVTFPLVVNSIWSDKQYVYVSSQGSAFVLNAATGEIVKRLDKVFSIDSNRARYHPQDRIYDSVLKGAFVSDGRHLYLFNASYLSSTSNTSAEFWIFDADTLECLRHEDLPKGHVVKRNVEPRLLNGKLYVSLTRSFWGSEGGALAEFDPEDIYSEFVCDADVPFAESVRANDEAQEYVLTTHHPSLDDILRYGESELKNLAIARGRCTFSKKVKNPAFNGVIHLAIGRDTLQPQPDADAKLAMLMKRLNAWGQSGHYASDGKTKISFRWEWL